MTLIFSTSDDYSTKQVLNYLHKFDQKVELFLEWDVIEKIKKINLRFETERR